MKQLVCGLILSFKGFALGCLALMSTAGASPLPCHQVEAERTECVACLLSLEVWDEPMIAVSEVTEVLLPSSEFAIPAERYFNDFTKLSVARNVIRPPPQLILWRGEEMFTHTIRLRL